MENERISDCQAHPHIPVGAVIHGRYVVQKHLASQQCSEMPHLWYVYQCKDQETGDQVVVKQANEASDNMADELFLRLSTTFSDDFKCEHHANEPVALISKYVNGIILKDWVSKYSEARVNPRRTLKLLNSLASELENFCQRTGHRFVDVRMDQVLVTSQDECRLLPNACSLHEDMTYNLDIINFAQLVRAVLLGGDSFDYLLLQPVKECKLDNLPLDKADCLRRGLRGEFVSCQEMMLKLIACYHLAEIGADHAVTLVDGVEMRMRWIAPGKFRMGSPQGERGRDDWTEEKPHMVTIENGFWIGVFPVTQREYHSVMRGENRSRFQGDDHPQDTLSWQDAVDFCEELNQHADLVGSLPDGYHFALPSEEQWEYACRAGSCAALYNGKELDEIVQSTELNAIAWYGGNKSDRSKKIVVGVGQRQPNAWGLHDMLGSVWEWTRDQTPAQTEQHWARGGCGKSAARFCRCASRKQFETLLSRNSHEFTGMRLAIVKKP